ncbi:MULTISPECIES: ABC transporter ATP-binding protein [Micromonospora]|uniref:ABC transporter ATP-binding protein n=1 Tax=Micromonospora solifontis TaxID=2487138 RepID=A0ABX9WC81_9ACTN|nr:MULTISPECIES: ABC transporter ATP-binding protein [Micromonospora]NES16293.1 ABC transporter ATP-binding protein [Micromonospora sp. PPF5-17B]NES38353.1 ABC transporter ATP-binding protein [Micromonospora solifontis]NES58105.1 ABC transporter ATP-binding protein [Micromonospora sp. PPF5-6]RNL95885.1 ABC transporter ATP-binding protein [Micromonospora solifontis]
MNSGPESASSEQSLRGTDLDLGYHGALVVHGAAIALRAGAVIALVGPNGSGKSTLLRALARLHPIAGGAVHLAGDVAAAGLPAREFARRVTLLAQSRPVPSGVTVRDVVGYGRHPYRGRWRADDPQGPAAVSRAMDVTGVAAMADRPVDELSGGELQRVWLATCLAQETQVLLLDEPTTFLDLRYQVEILDLMRDLADDHDVAVGVVLHDLNQAAAVADEVVLLHGGRVRATGSPAEVFTEQALTDTYGIRIEVTTDPLTGLVTTRPVGRHLTRAQV